VQVTDFNQGTTSGKFSFRAFNGEGNINAVKLLVDGVPSNSNNGNMAYIDMIFPLNIETIEVVRGTSDPRYGLHAIAGSADIRTRSGGSYIDARGSVGRHDVYEGQIAAGHEIGGFTQNYMVGYRNGKGYRDHGKSERLSLSGKWAVQFGPDVRLGAIARYYDGDAEEPGYLTFTNSRANPRMTNAFNATDAGTRDMRQYAVTLDASFSDSLDLTALAFYNRLDDDRYVKFSAAASQQRRFEQERHKGVSGALHWHGEGALPIMVEVGGNVEWQDNQSRRWLSLNRVPTSQTRDQHYDLSVGGIYAQVIVQPTDWLTITPAYRVDWVGGDFTNRLNNTAAPINDYGSIDQPKISVAVTPVAGMTVYGNWGKTYQIGLGSGAYLIPPRQANLAPSINEGWEIGVKYTPSNAFEARIAMWQQDASGEIKRRLNDPLGDFENVGATRRKGVDVQARMSPVDGLSFWGAVAWQEAVITTPDPATPALAGKPLDHTPEWLWSGGIEARPTDGLLLNLTARGQSDYVLTSTGTGGKWGDLVVVDFAATYDLNDHYQLGVSVKNLFDTYYEYVWWDGGQTLHSPADGTTATISVRVRY
jgi:iron complex outermembrane recepter protein